MNNPKPPPQNALWVHSALDDLGLTPAEFRVYAHLSRRAGNGVAWPAIASISKVCRLSRKTVIKAFNRLERRGLLQVDRGGGAATNRYRLVAMTHWPKSTIDRCNPNPQVNPDKEQCTTATEAPPKPDPGVTPKEALEGNPIRNSREGNPLRKSNDGGLKPSASRNNGEQAEACTTNADTKTFWMLIKQIECNAELIKGVQRRGLLDENDKWIFNNPADRDEYRRLKAERKALLERTRPAGVEGVKR